MTARSVHTLPHNYATKTHWLQWHAPNSPQNYIPSPSTITTPSNTLIPWSTPLTIPTASGCNQPFCHVHFPDRQTDRHTDRWTRRQVRKISAYARLIESDALIILHFFRPRHKHLSQWRIHLSLHILLCVPSYLSDLLRPYVPSRLLRSDRSTSANLLTLPRMKLAFSSRAFRSVYVHQLSGISSTLGLSFVTHKPVLHLNDISKHTSSRQLLSLSPIASPQLRRNSLWLWHYK